MTAAAHRAFETACLFLGGTSPIEARVRHASLPLSRVDPTSLSEREERLLREFLNVTSAWRDATTPLDEARAEWWANWIVETSLAMRAATATEDAQHDPHRH